MPHPLVSYLDARASSYEMTPRDQLVRTVESSRRLRDLLPNPYRIFGLDETQPSFQGFPIATSPVVDQIDALLESWIDREIEAVAGIRDAKEAAREVFRNYSRYVLKIVENAMLSNFLADYHAIFWFVHAGQLARHFSSIPAKLVDHDVAVGRDKGSSILFRIYNRWASTMRRGMQDLAERLHPMLDGEELRNLETFELLHKNVLIFTTPRISDDFAELKSFINGHLRQDAKELLGVLDAIIDRCRILSRDSETFRYSMGRFGLNHAGVERRSFLDGEVREYVFNHPQIRAVADEPTRARLDSLYAQIIEWDILRRVRDGLVWMDRNDKGEVVDATDPSKLYSRSTRPIDFGRVGVLDPIVYRFGLVYDLSCFSQTLAEIARGGVKKEINSYRQMFMFQKKLEAITSNHLLKFEKFLGDGAFYTTRRAMRLIHAAIEMQQLYGHLRSTGFVFDKGLRIALNYGYYRLLPLGSKAGSEQPLVEFYGPGIVELSRLTTGKSTQAIAEIQQYLIAHGYSEKDVTRFFAPVMKSPSGGTEEDSEREFYAYMDPNGNLVNEGIVASLALIEQLTIELEEAGNDALQSIESPWGRYVGFRLGIEGVETLGCRLLGQVALKGLDKVAVAEIVPFAPGECIVEPLEPGQGLLAVMRQYYMDAMQKKRQRPAVANVAIDSQHPPSDEGIALCSVANAEDSLIMLGRWSSRQNLLEHPVRLAGSDLQQLLGIEQPLRAASIETRKHSLCELYRKLAEHENQPPIPIEPLRKRPQFQAFLLGQQVEDLS